MGAEGKKLGRFLLGSSLALSWPAIASAAPADATGLLFRASADKGLTADRAAGDPVPNFQSNVAIVPTGKSGGAIQWQDDGYVAWRAPGNIYAQRGTLSFFWRPRTPVGEAPFVLFRVGFADHSSWDMAFLRIDWNGHGFDAFVTDANLARSRVSFRIDQLPAPDAVAPHRLCLGRDGRRPAVRRRQGSRAQGRQGAISMPGSTSSAWPGGSSRRTRCRAATASCAAAMSTRSASMTTCSAARMSRRSPTIASRRRRRRSGEAARRTAWLHRFGWDAGSPPPLTGRVDPDPQGRVRRCEGHEAMDVEGRRRHRRDDLARRLQPFAAARPRRLFRAARLEYLCRGRQGL